MPLKMLKPRLKPLGPRLRFMDPPASQGPAYGQGRGGRPWRRLRARILKRDGYLCQCPDCQARAAQGQLPLPANEVDHIVPRFENGTDDESNLQAMNSDCHRRKTAIETARARGRRGG